jgi:multimeric flavodoxin WrbA
MAISASLPRPRRPVSKRLVLMPMYISKEFAVYLNIIGLDFNTLRTRVAETLPEEVLKAMYAPPKSKNIPIITPDILQTYDAFLLGIPTRFGNFPAQWKAFWDSTGGQWGSGALLGKYAVGIPTGAWGC